MRNRGYAVRNRPVKRRVTVPGELTEKQMQVRVVAWAKKHGIVVQHCPNEGRRDIAVGSYLKQQGLQPGWPDICVPMMRKGYGALYIELKRDARSKVSDMQKYWLDYLAKQGYKTMVCVGHEAAIAAIKDYVGIV